MVAAGCFINVKLLNPFSVRRQGRVLLFTSAGGNSPKRSFSRPYVPRGIDRDRTLRGACEQPVQRAHHHHHHSSTLFTVTIHARNVQGPHPVRVPATLRQTPHLLTEGVAATSSNPRQFEGETPGAARRGVGTIKFHAPGREKHASTERGGVSRGVNRRFPGRWPPRWSWTATEGASADP